MAYILIGWSFFSNTFYTSTLFSDDDDELVGRIVVELDPDGDGKYSFTASTNWLGSRPRL